jgi:hypothetical protein
VTRVEVKNTGKTDLHITGIRSACNCVTLKTPVQKIKPGMAGFAELTYSPRVLGYQIEGVTISSNDVVSPESKVSLKAQVVTSLTAKSLIRETSNEIPFK